MTIDEIVTYLFAHASEKFKANVVKLGIPEDCSIGVPTTELRKFAKQIPKDKLFLKELWQTNYHECKILAVLAMKPKECTNEDIYFFMEGIQSWDLCDLFCKTIVIKMADYDVFIQAWIVHKELFYKRAAFTLIASTSTHASLTVDEIKGYLTLIETYSDDERLLVKKAVSWALRELGKTNEVAKVLSIETAGKLKDASSKAQQWIAKDALKELELLVKVDGRKRLISAKSKMGSEG